MDLDPNNLNYDSDKEIDNLINNVLNELNNKFVEWRMLQTAIDNMEKCNREMAAKKRELKRSIESLNEQEDLREKLNKVLGEKLKYLEERYAHMTAYKNKSFQELVSDFSSELAKHRVLALRRTQQAPPRLQPHMAPSTADEPPNEPPAPASKSSDFGPKN